MSLKVGWNLYSKGDTFKTENGPKCLVLNDGIRGKEFVYRYEHKVVQRFNGPLSRTHGCVVACHWAWTLCELDWNEEEEEEEVYYSILIGDMKGWVEARRLGL